MNAAEQALADLLEWSAQMGGWDSPAWERARAIVDAARNAGDQAHPSPWSVQGLGDTSALLDGADKIVLEVPWDGKQNGDGGVNDALLSIAGTINGFAGALTTAAAGFATIANNAADPAIKDLALENFRAAKAAL